MATFDEWLALAPQPQKLTDNQRWHIFLSYRSVHRPWVVQLYDILRHLNFEVFLDQYVLAASDTLVGGLAEGLEKSAAGVLIWSAATQDSVWCKKECDSMEARATSDQGFHYVVTTLDRVDLPHWAQQRIYIDFADFREGPRGTGLLKLLYGIAGKPLPAPAVRLATEVDEEVRKALMSITGALNTGDVQRLLDLSMTETLAWITSPLLGCNTVDALIKLKRYDEAVKLLISLRTRFPKAIRTQQLHGLVLARMGEWRAAQAILSDLEAAGEQDPETLGIYARTWMDRYQESKMINHLRRSRDLYARAFQNAPHDYYTGINAASKSVFLNEIPAATDYANKVETIVGTKKVDQDYWKTATVAEVQLIKQNYRNAAELYEAAVTMEPESLGSHESTWLQARRLMDVLKPSGDDRALVSKAFAHLPVP